MAGLLMLGLTGCSGSGGPGKDGQTGTDGAISGDQSTGGEGGGGCQEGDKRCLSLQMVQTCSGGVWVDHENCGLKRISDDLGLHICSCSATYQSTCIYAGRPCP